MKPPKPLLCLPLWLLACCGFALLGDVMAEAVEYQISDNDGLFVEEVSFLQPQPLLVPDRQLLPQTPSPTGAALQVTDLFGTAQLSFYFSAQRRAATAAPSRSVILGGESQFRISSDIGNLIGKSPSALGVGVQKRNPVVTDQRVRGDRVGSSAASGSYWVPARIDLDTTLSKIDSRNLSNVVIIPGPFAVQYGPGFEFTDFELLPAPRFEGGWQSRSRSSFEYQSNGQQLHGREAVWAGNDEWGYRVSYGYRVGNDYESGSGFDIPSSYKSGELHATVSRDFADDTLLELTYLRMDQDDVEFAGQAFDIDRLETDAFETRLVRIDQPSYDRLEVEGWYNRTFFNGSAQRPGKRRQFPLYDLINFVAFTDVDSTSTGGRVAWSWGADEGPQLTAGADFRYVLQELNELSSGNLGFQFWQGANSPIPESYAGNPGGFLEYTHPVNCCTTIRAGTRIDSVQTNVIDEAAKLAALGLEQPQHSLQQILGSNDLEQSFRLWAAYATAEHQINDCWTATMGFGYAERAPNLTELYAAESFMFLLQNGLNVVVGDPRLNKERRYQLDVGLAYDGCCLRWGARGYYAWMRDYITFENMRTLTVNAGTVDQLTLKYVNTDRALLAGGELYAEYDWTEQLSPFATLQYVEGRDLTRNGNFATRRATGGMASARVAGLPRGTFSGTLGGREEPLPGISPLELRVGLRIHEPLSEPSWMLELSARVVDNQDRVATSLFESTTPGYTVWDLRGFWRPNENWLFTAGVENFGDRTYREHLDFRSPGGTQMFQPGASFYGGVERTF